MKDILEIYLKLGPSMSLNGSTIKFELVQKPGKYYSTLPKYEDISWTTFEKPEEIQQKIWMYLQKKDSVQNQKIFDCIKEVLRLRAIKNKEIQMQELAERSLNKLEGSGFDLKHLKIIQPLNIHSDYRFAQSQIWDTKNDKLLGPEVITPEGLEKYLYSNLEDKTIAKEFLSRLFLPATTIFDPTRSFGVQADNKNPLTLFNTASPQPWKAKTPRKREPKEFIDFIDFFIPDPLEKVEVMQWLYAAAYYKNHFALVLCGVKGTGKGIFSTLAKRITAGSYLEAFDAPESMGSSSHFNSSLLNARLCVFDEITINSKNKDRLKRLMNNYATLEGKGVDAQKNVKLWANFIVSNNFPLENFLEWDDRRFLVPTLTQVKIEKEWGPQKIDDLIYKIENDDQFICDVVEYLKNNIKRQKPKTNPLRTSLFYKIVYFSLNPWQKTLLEFPFKTSEKKESYPLVDIRSFHKMQFKNSDDQDASKRFAQTQSVSQFLENYRHGKDQVTVAELDSKSRENTITYSKEYLNLKGEV